MTKQEEQLPEKELVVLREINMMEGPTSEECSSHAAVLAEGRAGFAIWYPQMGGYSSHAFVSGGADDCFNALVWHDGEFAFGDRRPARLHHCMPSQFVNFGRKVQELLGSEVEDAEFEEQRAPPSPEKQTPEV